MKEILLKLNVQAFIFLLFAFVLVLVACGPHTSSKGDDQKTMTTNDKKEAPVTYVAVGDSTGVGVGAGRDGGYPARLLKRIKQERTKAKLVNFCVSGATSEDLLRMQLEPAIAARPTLITVAIGINDMGHYVAVEKFARNFEEIVRRLKTETSAAIVVSNLPDISFAPVAPVGMREQLRAQIKLFNQHIAEIVKRYEVSLVDAYTETHSVIPAHPEFFSDDGFHPSDAGYEYWAKAMWPAVKAAIDK